MSRTTWGALLSASLAAGCSAAPTQPAGPTPSPPSPPAPAASALLPSQPSLSPPVDALPEPTEGTEEPIGTIRKIEIPYGRGVLLYEHVDPRGPFCPLLRDDGCSFHTVSSNGKSPDERAWLDATASPPPSSRPGKRLPSPRDWISFSAGRDSIFALAQGGKIIDRIDDQGQVTRLAQDSALAGWQRLWVFEQGDRLLALGLTDKETLVAGELTAAASASEPRKLGPLTALPMLPIHSHRPNAQGAREASRKGKLAMVGSPRAIFLPDEGAKNAWAVAWVEAVPPPYDWPAGKPRGDSGGGPAAAPRKGEKHGCGGPGSRPLTDRSVEKKVHITRFSGAASVDDKVAWASNRLDPFRPLAVRLDEGKLVVEPSSASPSALSPAESFGGLTTKIHEQIVAAAFDTETQEGMVMAVVDNKDFARRFNAEGALVGDPIRYPPQRPSDKIELARSGKSWLGVSIASKQIFSLTDVLPPQPWHYDNLRALALLSGQPQAQLLLAREDQDKTTLLVVPVDEHGKITGDPAPVVELSKGMDLGRSAIHSIPDSPPMLAILEQLGEAQEGGKSSSRNRLAWTWLRAGSSWNTLPELPPTPLADSPEESRQPVRFKRVDGDLVAWLPHDKELLLSWMRARKTLTLADPPAHSALTGETSEPGGNVLARGELLLPAQPGVPIASPELDRAERECSVVLPTGPTTTVFVCERPSDPFQPIFRVALRLHRAAPAKGR